MESSKNKCLKSPVNNQLSIYLWHNYNFARYNDECIYVNDFAGLTGAKLNEIRFGCLIFEESWTWNGNDLRQDVSKTTDDDNIGI